MTVAPLLEHCELIPFGDLKALEQMLQGKDVAAFIVEPIQGEGGAVAPPKGYLTGAADLCRKFGTLLIFDEIQTGMGRTGKMFACQHANVTPDIMCLSKGIASGLPLGATMAKEEIMSSIGIGDHSSTFGGGPIQCAAGAATIDVLIEEKLPEKAASNGKYILNKIHEMGQKYKTIREARGMGLMIGVETRLEIINIMNRCQEKNVLTLEAGRNILRLLPPLVPLAIHPLLQHQP